ncbi:MAG: hypothetical protein WDN02_05180 [Methylovirgula sp.]|uniref:hypothetical protein n=1 Tax=Methylovirgula sp. TaxID=1978224 RepID=UPI003075EEEE
MSQTGEPALFGKYGTQYNTQDTCPAGQFGVDNKAGRTVAAADTLTVSGSAAGILSNCASTIGATCGVQSSVVAQANLANFTLPSSASASTSSFASVSDPGHSHVQNGSSATVGAENNDNVNPLNGGTSNTRSAVTGISVSVSSSTSVGTTVTSGGSATPLSLVQPTKIVYLRSQTLRRRFL